MAGRKPSSLTAASKFLTQKTAVVSRESSILWPKQWFSTRDSFILQGTLATPGDHFGCYNLGGEALWASNEWRPALLLSILCCPGRSPHQTYLPYPQVTNAEAEKFHARSRRVTAFLGQNFQIARFFKAAKDLEVLCCLTVFNTWKISL